MDSISRRDLLAAGGLAVSSAVSGCILDDSGAGTGHIYIENTDSEEHRVALWVAGGEGDDPIVESWYQVPAGYALEFEGVIEEGQTYDVRAALPDAAPQDRVAVTIDPCSGDPAGERVVSVRTRPDGLGVIPWGCEDSYSEGEMEYVAASEYERESLDGTVAASSGGETTTATAAGDGASTDAG